MTQQLRKSGRLLTLALATLMATGPAVAWERESKGQKLMTSEQIRARGKVLNAKRSVTSEVKPGMGEGSSTISVKLNLPKQPANRLTRSAAEPRGKFLAIVPQFSGMMVESLAYMGTVDLNAGTITPIARGSYFRGSSDFEWQSAALANSLIYQTNESSNVFDYSTLWSVIDASSGKQLRTIDFHADPLSLPYSLTYDEVTGNFYGIAFSEDGSAPNNIVCIDPSTTTVYDLGIVGNKGFLSAICYYPVTQDIVIFNDSNESFIFDRESHRLSDFGSVVSPSGDSLLPTNSASIMTYSPLDQAFVTAVPNDYTQTFDVYFIDQESFEAELVGSIGGNSGAYVASLICTDPYADWEAPALPAKPVVSFGQSSLTGTISFTVPAEYYSGVAINPSQKVNTVLTLDGEKIVDEAIAPGTTRQLERTVTTGQHTVALTCEIGGKTSPTATTVFYTGNDNPQSPRNLRYDGQRTLTWDAPAEGGAHGGYVDASKMYYDVYFGNVKQNSRPITDTSYTFVQSMDMSLVAISVRAVCDGMESQPAVLNEIIGRALTLPVDLTTDESNKDIIKVVDANGDGNSFNYWAPSGLPFNAFMMNIGYYNDADDWVILPRMKFDDPSKLYNLSLYIGGIYTGRTREDMEIFIGKTPDVRAMNTRVWNRTNIICPLEPSLPTNIAFAVPEAGEYCVGIHYISQKSRNGRGLTLRDFKVEQTDKSSAVPAAVSDVAITADPQGNRAAEVEVTLPLKDAVGNDLDPAKELTLVVECMSTEPMEPGMAKGLPGARVKAKVDAATDGINQFVCVPQNENGNGVSSSYEAYVGLDTPAHVRNLKGWTSDDNLTFNISWEKPSSVGEHGGYVNTDNLWYDIFLLSGVQRSKIDSTDKLTYSYKPLDPTQNHYWMGPASANELAATTDVPFAGDLVGNLYELPMNEEYGTTRFDCPPVYRRTGDGYKVAWSNERVVPADLDGTPTVRNGCIFMYNEEMTPQVGEITLPKFTSKGARDLVFTARIWDYKNVPSVSIYGATNERQEPKLIKKIDFERGSTGTWNEEVIKLPEEYSDCPWVQLFIRTEFTVNPEEYLVLDSYQIREDLDYDLKLATITGPEQCAEGREFEIYTRISNGGAETNSGSVDINIYGDDGTFIANRHKTLLRMRPGDALELYTKFEMLPEWSKYSNIEVRATVNADTDEQPANNTRTWKIIRTKNTLPVVTDLAGKLDDSFSDVTLNWSEPDLRHGADEDFETDLPFELNDKIGLFRNVDMDGRKCFPIEGLTWPNRDEAQAWTVMDAKTLGLMNDERLYPHSGNQYLLARALDYDFASESAPQAADWLISPEVVPGSKISFYYNTLSVEYKEFLELWVSSTDDTLGSEIIPGEGSQPDRCGSFRKVRSWSKSGSETWERVEQTLPADAKYFAIVYRSFDSFGAMIDDISFSPVELPVWTIDHYNVYRFVETDPDNCEFVDGAKTGHLEVKNAGDYNAQYFVYTHVNTPKGVIGGPRSNIARIFSSGIDDLNDLSGVYGTYGAILVKGHASETVEIYDTAGKYLRTVRMGGDNERIAIEPGLYVVKAGNSMAKVIVK